MPALWEIDIEQTRRFSHKPRLGKEGSAEGIKCAPQREGGWQKMKQHKSFVKITVKPQTTVFFSMFLLINVDFIDYGVALSSWSLGIV